MEDYVDMSLFSAAHFPAATLQFLKTAGLTAWQRHEKLFLVGGAVRDLCLGRVSFDLDLVVEGNAIDLAQTIIQNQGGRLAAVSLFKTVKIELGPAVIDIASARLETYRRPGDLPTLIGPADIRQDLARRDFSVNAMAIDLGPDRWGEFIDPFHGRQDISQKLIRVLHERSFQDDATRLWRAIRYEQRLDFEIEKQTLQWLRRDLDYLETISPDRLRNELQLCLTEPCPAKLIQRAAGLGLLGQIVPGWQPSHSALHALGEAAGGSFPLTNAPEMGLAILSFDLENDQIGRLIDRLNPDKPTVNMLRDIPKLKLILPGLTNDLPRSRIYRLLKPFSKSALLAAACLDKDEWVRALIKRHLDEFCRIKPAINGEDLLQAGVPAGPLIGRILEMVKDAKIDGRLETRAAELDYALKTYRAGFEAGPADQFTSEK